MDTDSGGDPDLGETKSRDPDALPPTNLFELVMFWAYRGFASLGGGNVTFALKASLLTGRVMNLLDSPICSSSLPVALSLPYHIKNAAAFAYRTCH
jgi:hypothetical protein